MRNILQRHCSRSRAGSAYSSPLSCGADAGGAWTKYRIPVRESADLQRPVSIDGMCYARP
jgi:hypothetical protein